MDFVWHPCLYARGKRVSGDYEINILCLRDTRPKEALNLLWVPVYIHPVH